MQAEYRATDEFTTDTPEHSKLTPKRYWDRRARGLGGTIETPVVSCGEENLLHLEGDPYAAENILLHEFAHSVHLIGMARLDPGYDKRLRAAYAAAKAGGLWGESYAMSNHEEYFAEGSQTWFNCNANVGPVHGKVRTREELQQYDPLLAGLLFEAYGNNPWRYQRPQEDAHAEAKATPPKRFVWPARLSAPAILKTDP